MSKFIKVHLKAQDNHDTFYDDISYLAKDLVGYAEDTDPGSDYDRHEVADFLSDLYQEQDIEYIKKKIQTPEGFEKVMNSAYLAFIRTKRTARDEVKVTRNGRETTLEALTNERMSTSSNEAERKLHVLGKRKGLSSVECSSVYRKYKDICGDKWSQGTALELITDVT